MTGRVSFEPKNTYLRDLGSGFSSNLGGSTIEGSGGEKKIALEEELLAAIYRHS